MVVMNPFEVRMLSLLARFECVLDELSMSADADEDLVEVLRRELSQLRISVFLVTNPSSPVEV